MEREEAIHFLQRRHSHPEDINEIDLIRIIIDFQKFDLLTSADPYPVHGLNPLTFSIAFKIEFIFQTHSM